MCPWVRRFAEAQVFGRTYLSSWRLQSLDVGFSSPGHPLGECLRDLDLHQLGAIPSSKWLYPFLKHPTKAPTHQLFFQECGMTPESENLTLSSSGAIDQSSCTGTPLSSTISSPEGTSDSDLHGLRGLARPLLRVPLLLLDLLLITRCSSSNYPVLCSLQKLPAAA